MALDLPRPPYHMGKDLSPGCDTQHLPQRYRPALVKTICHFTTCLGRVFCQQRAQKLLIALLAGFQYLYADKLGMILPFLNEAASRIPDERQAARHACAEVHASRSQDYHRTTRHVFAGVIADSFYH